MITGTGILLGAGAFMVAAIGQITWRMQKVELNDNAWYIWVALGSNPTDRCLALDGRILLGRNIEVFPMHPNCQCGLFEADPVWIAKMILDGEAVEVDGELKFTSTNLTELKEYAKIQNAD